jgi:hypothetical protein
VDEARRDLWRRHGDVSIAPRWDGSHLVTAWAIARDMQLFEPWYDRRGSAALALDDALDPVALDAKVLDLLKAGDAWREATRALLDYPLEARLAQSGLAHDTLDALRTKRQADQNQL